MIPEVGMRVRLNTPNDENYMGAKNGDEGILDKPATRRSRWYVRWDKFPTTHYYNYALKELQFRREK